MGLLLTLAARGWWPFGGDSLHERVLGGSTERGHRITMSFLSGKLNSFDTHVSAWCPYAREWHGWRWSPNPNVPNTTFRQHEGRFYVREVGRFPQADPPYRIDGVMRGTLAEDGRSAKGTIVFHSMSGRGDNALSCSGTVGFGVRELRR